MWLIRKLAEIGAYRLAIIAKRPGEGYYGWVGARAPKARRGESAFNQGIIIYEGSSPIDRSSFEGVYKWRIIRKRTINQKASCRRPRLGAGRAASIYIYIYNTSLKYAWAGIER